MIEKHPQPIDARCLGADVGLGRLDILAILPAARVRAECRGKKSERVPDPVLGHLPQGVSQEWMPIAVAPVNGQSWSVVFEFPGFSAAISARF